jgi:hypothetical protein
MITIKLSTLSSVCRWKKGDFIVELQVNKFCVYNAELDQQELEWVKKDKIFEFVTTLPANEDTLTELRRLYFATFK